jgi:preprotein translocase subunit SecD
VRGFAVVHCLGILTSMFQRWWSRAAGQPLYGRQKRKLKSVSIGQVWKPGPPTGGHQAAAGRTST